MAVVVAYLAPLFVQLGDELILRPVHGALLSSHGDEGDASLRVVRVHELAEGLQSLLVLSHGHPMGPTNNSIHSADGGTPRATTSSSNSNNNWMRKGKRDDNRNHSEMAEMAQG